MWLYIAIFGYALLAVVSILDKFVVSGGRLKPIVVTFYSTAPLFVAFALVPFGVIWPDGFSAWAAIFISAGTFLLALWAMYRGLVHSEVSHMGPLIGAAMPFFTMYLSHWFLGETVTSRQLVAIGFLIIGSAIISFEQSRRSRGWHVGMLWGVAAGLFFAMSNVASKYVYDGYGFYSGMVWTRGVTGVFGLLLLCLPLVWRNIFHGRKERPGESKQPARATGFIVAVDKILGVVGVLVVQYATALGSVTLVNALVGVEYALLIVLVACISRFKPQIFREDYRHGEVVQEILAVIFIALGLALLIL